MPLNAEEHTNTPTGDKMRRVNTGTKIQVPTQLGIDYGIIVEHCPSRYSKDVYMVKWGDGSQTLFHLKKENLIKNDSKTTKNKTT